jgi:succinate-semialdehyde dehydrogenase / glutarate-semialdehyde dehydrogenase
VSSDPAAIAGVEVPTRLAAVRLGPGLEDGVELGPLVNAATRDKVARLVTSAADDGGRVVLGGEAPRRPGYFYPATLLDDGTEYGLVSYLYSADLRRALQVAEALEAGMVGINRGVVSDPAAPFGGVKQSGIGREGGHDGLLEFTETKYVAVDW